MFWKKYLIFFYNVQEVWERSLRSCSWQISSYYQKCEVNISFHRFKIISPGYKTRITLCPFSLTQTCLSYCACLTVVSRTLTREALHFWAESSTQLHKGHPELEQRLPQKVNVTGYGHGTPAALIITMGVYVLFSQYYTKKSLK